MHTPKDLKKKKKPASTSANIEILKQNVSCFLFSPLAFNSLSPAPNFRILSLTLTVSLLLQLLSTSSLKLKFLG